MNPLRALCGLSILLLGACNSNLSETLSGDSNSEPNPDSQWSNLLDDHELKPQTFKVNVAQGGVFVTKSGSQIHIPQAAFVDAQGNVITGEVDIVWNEYHSLSDQLFSGINMLYDSAGVVAPFISGGMFSIDGTQNGRLVFIAQDKSLKIELNSESDQEIFNFYKQDENGTWSYISNTTSEPRAEEKPNTVSGMPVSAPPVKRDGFIFDAQPKNINDFTEFADREIVGWQTSKPLASRDRFLLKNELSVCELQKKDVGDYDMNFMFKKDTFAYPVTPYFIEDAARETASNRVVLEAKIQETTINLENLEKQQIIRNAEISSFGTYNWDVCARMKNKQPFFANFDSEDPTIQLEKMCFALVCLSDNYQVRFQPETTGFFDAAEKNTIIAIDPNGNIYYASPSNFDKFANKPMTRTDYFVLTNSGVSLNNASDLDEVIRQLKTI